MSNNVGIARRQECFLMRETSRGTLVPPTASGLIIAAGIASLNQQPSFTNSSNVRNSRDITERFRDQSPPAGWSIPLYLTPSGAKGTAPAEDVLIESLLGNKTVNASTSVVYTQALEKPSFSMWLKQDHIVFNCSGCTAGTAKFALATKDGAKLNISGQGMKMGWAGTDATASLISSSATSIPVDDARKYTVGALIEFEEADGTVYNNTNAGYEITAIDVETDTLTIADGAEAEIESGAIVRGWLPDGVEVGSPLASRLGYAQLDGSDFNVQAMSCDITDAPRYLDDEITADGYITDYAETTRNISGSIAIYFREDDSGYFYDGLESVQKALKMVFGDTEGSIVEISMPYASVSVPKTEVKDPVVALSMTYLALGSSGEDSLSITYK